MAMMYQKTKILVVDPLHIDALNDLRNRFDVTIRMKPSLADLERLIVDTEVVILRSGVSLDASLIEQAKQLKVIARAGVGMDNIDLKKAREREITVFNVPDESSRSVAEFGFGLILALSRKIALADTQMRRGLLKKTELEGIELCGKILGLVGLGRIGSEMAQIAQGFRMQIIANVANPNIERRAKLAEKGISLLPLDEVLSHADIICLVLPLTNKTEGLIRLSQFEVMKTNAILINLSRAKIIDFFDLMIALKRQMIQGIATDVISDLKEIHLLSQFENVLLTPHIGAMTQEAQRRIGQKIVAGIEAALDNRLLFNYRDSDVKKPLTV